uniref:Acyl_transf_3 domain-containing protein n=1 Tax=Caenorhabditis tropicalis TaxID=1561998 RepID=A0A1I7TSY7_9PELO
MDLFTHTWSLSVEIQFYFIVPFIFLIGHQLRGAFKYGFYMVIAFSSFIFYAISPPMVSFHSVFARIWQFLIGMLTYFLSRHQRFVPFETKKSGKEQSILLIEEDPENIRGYPDRTVNVFVKCIILSMMITVVLIPWELHTLVARLFFTIFTGAIILLSVEDYILNSRILIYFGNVSYALYLIHWPIYAYAKLVFKGNSYLLGASLALSVILAVIVYETYEKWYLKQSTLVIFLLIVVLCASNEFLVRKDEIQDMMRPKIDVIEFDAIGNHSGRLVIRKFPRLDAWRENMSLNDAQRMNTYWNQHDHIAPELQVPGCKRRNPKYLWCDFQGNGTEYSIAMLGNSYVLNHYKMFIQECDHRAHTFSKEDETGCEVLASPRREVDNGGMSVAWVAQCAYKLNEFVEFIKDTQPDYAFVFTRFVAISEPYDIDENHLGNDTIYLEMKSQLSRLLPHIKKKLFLIDSFPRIKRDRMDDIIPDLRRGKTMEEINKYLYNPNGFERGRRRHAELIKNECQTKCELIDYVDAFWNKTMNAFQYFDAGGLLYFTSGYHLSAHGIEHVRPIYRKICDRL